jgi:hypothetical protein
MKCLKIKMSSIEFRFFDLLNIKLCDQIFKLICKLDLIVIKTDVQIITQNL